MTPTVPGASPGYPAASRGGRDVLPGDDADASVLALGRIAPAARPQAASEPPGLARADPHRGRGGRRMQTRTDLDTKDSGIRLRATASSTPAGTPPSRD